MDPSVTEVIKMELEAAREMGDLDRVIDLLQLLSEVEPYERHAPRIKRKRSETWGSS